jgi:hypothetical protein
MPTTKESLSDTFSDEIHNLGNKAAEAGRPVWRELADLARSWNSPLEMATKLKSLMAERPWVALGAAVVIGAMLRGRFSRPRYARYGRYAR